MIKYEGTHICDFCGAQIDWIHIIPRKVMISGNELPEVITYPPDKAKAYRFDPIGDGLYSVVVACPHCHEDNTFRYK